MVNFITSIFEWIEGSAHAAVTLFQRSRELCIAEYGNREKFAEYLFLNSRTNGGYIRIYMITSITSNFAPLS